MNLDFLDFEQPIAELQEKIEALRRVGVGQDINLADDIATLEKKSQQLTESIYRQLSAQQVVQVARHPMRPHTLDYIDAIFTDYQPLQGDRHFSKASALVGGLARLDGQPVMVIGQQKGHSTKEKVDRNFGMTTPEGFRTALRLMKMAEKFQLPIFTLIDTPGAYPGIGAEERNQSEAIARNLYEMSQLRTPIICTVLGEGCSGGALAIGVGDKTLMLQYSYYSVISPEGCATILWKSAARAADAAEALNLTAPRLAELGLIDQVIPEPLGGAHRDPALMFTTLATHLKQSLAALQSRAPESLVDQRYARWLQFGR